ncbi:MAG: chemotaxis protein CheB [Polyangiaceae bacterium]
MVQASDASSEATGAAGYGSFLIAAVGASAGGLAPTSELLRELGANPGIAVVVIHHLDATHESKLVEILSRTTSMPVAGASDGARIEPGHVYVVLPNEELLIHQGILKVMPRLPEGGLHLPIDRFFESLALDQDSLGAGVVLSGSGFDGTEGVKAIKREGGIALAQDATAEYASMPQSAVATGCVDFVLPAGGLARELRRLGSHAQSLRATSSQHQVEERDYRQILGALRNASGVDFSSYKPATIRRRLQRRLILHGLTDLPAYVELLKRDPAEVRALGEDVLIHVTGFFREPETFEALRSQVFPKLCEDPRRDSPIRVWVPGCSTGEELYSIAIALLEFLGDAHKDVPIKLFGTDLSLAAVEKARAGRFTESIERDVSQVRLQRFFSKNESVYQIRRDVRDLCIFAQHDVTRDPPFSAMDLVSCRNLMIYLGPQLQDRVIALLHFALKEPGFLVLGNAETARAFAGFVAVDGKNKIYARTSAAPRLAFDFTTPRLPLDLSSARPGAVATPERAIGARAPGPSEVQREADRLVLAAFGPPGVVVTPDLAIIEFRGQTGPFLEHAPGAASLDLLRTAREELKLPLRRAIERARATQRPERETGITFLIGEKPRSVTLEVIPFVVQPMQRDLLLVLFEDVSPKEGVLQEPGPASVDQRTPTAEQALRQELASTRQFVESAIEQLEATNEELRSANEEIVSSNEELRSTNEELQRAKEELQAKNEELRTVNDELSERNVEATRLSDDLTNVLTSTEIPIIIVGRDLRLRRFTPAAGRVFGLLGTHLGRPIGDAQQFVAIAPEVIRLVPKVLEHFNPVECAIQDHGGRWYQVSVRPYVTLDARIDGTVISARDVDAEKRVAERLAAAGKYAEGIVETVRDGLVVLDRDLRVTSTNTAFRRAFRLAPENAKGRRLEDLGCTAFAIPALQKVLEGLGRGQSTEDFRLEHGAADGSTCVFLLDARRIEGADLFLLALRDVTEAERVRIARTDLSFRDALTGAAEGVLMVDRTGRVLFANPALARDFGFESEELTEMSVDVLLPERFREVHARHRAEYLAAPSARPMGRGLDLVGRRKDGSEFPIEVVLSTMTREDAVVVVAFVTDVTERREAERQIRVYQERLRRMAFDAALTEERERRRIAIELHDRIGQALALAQIKLTSLGGELAGASRVAVDGAVALLAQAIADQRTLIFELSPPILYDLGLKEALGWLAEDLEKRFGVHIDVVDDGAEKPLDDTAKAVIFRAVRELVMNVLKHAKAPATVSLRRSDDHLEIDVKDRGIGFDPEAPTDGPTDRGFGLLSVREQIVGLVGTLKIESAPHQGTRVTIRVPLQANPSANSPGTDNEQARRDLGAS